MRYCNDWTRSLTSSLTWALILTLAHNFQSFRVAEPERERGFSTRSLSAVRAVLPWRSERALDPETQASS
jgi:hypothetical protein